MSDLVFLQASRNNIYMYIIVEQLNCHFHITIYHTQAEYANYYITDSVSSEWQVA
jgi:hypothetical protein